MHVLCYGYKIDNPVVTSIVDNVKDMRRRKVDILIDHLDKKHGFKIPQQRIDKLKATVANIGKPHLVEILGELGFVSRENTADVYKKYLDDIKLPQFKLKTEEVLPKIKPEMGVTVLAHPIELMEEYNLTYADIDELVGELKELGLGGLEIYYSKHTPKDRKEFLKIARKYGLTTTCGSDFHGLPKPKVKLGFIGQDLTQADYGNIKDFVSKIFALNNKN